MSYRPQPGPSITAQRQPSPLPSVPQIANTTLGQPGTNIQAQQAPQAQASGPSASVTDKGPDYVYFERKPTQFGEVTTGKATAAKMKLELYYKEAVEGVVGRKER